MHADDKKRLDDALASLHVDKLFLTGPDTGPQAHFYAWAGNHQIVTLNVFTAPDLRYLRDKIAAAGFRVCSERPHHGEGSTTWTFERTPKEE